MRSLFAACVLSVVLITTAVAGTELTVHPALGAVVPRVTDELNCKVLADAAKQLGGEVIPDAKSSLVGHTEVLHCTRAFTAAGATLAPVPEDGKRANWNHRHAWHLTIPQFTSDSTAIVSAEDHCPLCGHGEMVVLTREGTYWKITQRETAWRS